MRLYCVSQILRKGQIICSDLQSAGDIQTLIMQSGTFTIMSTRTVVTVDCLSVCLSVCGDEDRERETGE